MSGDSRDDAIQKWNRRAAPAIPDGYVLVPREMTPEMVDSAVKFAINVSLSSSYGWAKYMRDLWGINLAAAPTINPPETDSKLMDACTPRDDTPSKSRAKRVAAMKGGE